MSSDLTRRQLIKTGVTAAAVAGIPTWFAKRAEAAEMELASLRPKRIGPNDKVRIGAIGLGGSKGGFARGKSVTNWARGKEEVEIVAIADCDRVHRMENEENFKCEGYHDYRDLLERDDIDAVIIGTPDHWHHRICLDAMKAGKDVYCEKPLTVALSQGREIADMARKTKTVFQTGSQQRSDGRFRLACELVRNGRIGKLTKVVTHLPTGPTGGPFETKQSPYSLDWNMWQGPAAVSDYCKDKTHGSFRWWLDYSGGMLTDWGAHHHDIAQWGLGMDESGPLSVTGTAKTQPVIGPNCYSTYPEYDVYFEYPDDILLHSTNQGENGVTFIGEEGEIFVSRGRIGASDKKLISDPLADDAIRLYESDDHMQNWLDCLVSRKDPICHAEVGHRSVSVCHLANISLRLGGRKMTWDAAAEQFIGDAEGNTMLHREPRDWENA
jgi:predicted dehydrogenase